MAHDRIEKPALLAFCDPGLWTKPMHLVCAGRTIIKFHEPSGSGPWTMGVCICPCHDQERNNIRDDNLARFEYWRRNRAPLQERKFELDRQEGKRGKPSDSSGRRLV